MKQSRSTAGRIAYGRKLVSAGVRGIRMQGSSLRTQAVAAFMVTSVRDSLKLAAAGACLGLLPTCVAKRRQNLSTLLALSALGSTVGFCAGLSWKTRKLTSSLADSALRELQRTSDEHWLELNPVDYA